MKKLILSLFVLLFFGATTECARRKRARGYDNNRIGRYYGRRRRRSGRGRGFALGALSGAAGGALIGGLAGGGRGAGIGAATGLVAGGLIGAASSGRGRYYDDETYYNDPYYDYGY